MTTRPKPKPKRVEPYDLPAIHRLLVLNVAELAPPLALTWHMAVTALYTGVRRGELGILTWEGTDFAAGAITMAHERTIPLHQELAPILLNWRKLCPTPTGLLFPQSKHTPLALLDLMGVQKVPPLPWHAFRATMAKFLMQATDSKDVVARILGHIGPTSMRTAERLRVVLSQLDMPYLQQQMAKLSFQRTPEGR